MDVTVLCTYCRIAGTSTATPIRPYTTLGTAASSSVSIVSTSEMRGGASSARNSAAPTPSGTATISAISEVTSVP